MHYSKSCLSRSFTYLFIYINIYLKYILEGTIDYQSIENGLRRLFLVAGKKKEIEKDYNTRAFPHPLKLSYNEGLLFTSLALEMKRDPMLSSRHGRSRMQIKGK